ncbi:AAA family ATPase [Corynebacterium sp. TAE3-ERU12]|uniref:ArsA family ATPase n=1 Tax=Corynebacterium sp. TAE3-ERU12 TaxID=2849491 RepID=UPI001C4879DB|nr:ArsA-related P-loop ATPase [Corynebacterium sp. TAE3-ERU12]MBV7294472.1 AAA family ATPase [Corynebacterium sp. TAE3-ERU12]
MNAAGDARVIVLVGPGGVGKTTVSAGLAVGLAQSGARTLVLTIDPAKRLAQALGLAELGGEPVAVPGVANLSALMLDQQQRFRQLMARSGAAELADNPVAQTVARSFGGLQEYLAMDLLAELYAQQWDVIVVDTPPAQNALDFLDSAERMGRLLGHPLMRVLTGSTSVVGAGVELLGRIVGSGVLRSAAEFARVVSPVANDVLARSRRMRQALAERGEFVVVTAPMVDSLREAREMSESLTAQGIAPRAAIVNRLHPVSPALVDAAGLADADVASAGSAADGGDEALAALLAVHRFRVVLARAEQKQLSRFRRWLPKLPITTVPAVRGGIGCTDDLRDVAAAALPAIADEVG